MAGAPKGSRIPFYRLVASGVDLASAFKSVVDAFNARDLKTLMALCDDSIVVVEITRLVPSCGKAAAAACFSQQFSARPTFSPRSSQSSINPGTTVGHVIGVAEWTSSDASEPGGAPTECIIQYAFNFVRRGNNWMLSTWWGCPEQLSTS